MFILVLQRDFIHIFSKNDKMKSIVMFVCFMTVLGLSCLQANSNSTVDSTTEINITNTALTNKESGTGTTDGSDQENTISTDISDSGQVSTDNSHTVQVSTDISHTSQVSTDNKTSQGSSDVTTEGAVAVATTDKLSEPKVIRDTITYLIILGVCVFLIAIALFTSRFEAPPVTIETVITPPNPPLESDFQNGDTAKKGLSNGVKFDDAVCL